MSRSASAAPRSPATVEKRANIGVFLPISEKILALLYLVMSWVTVKVPNAPAPLACIRRSGITSRSKWANFSINQMFCNNAGPRLPAVAMFWLSSTGAPNDVVSFLSILSSIGASVGELALNGASAIFGCGCTGPFSLAVSEALCYLVASRVGEQLECQSLSKEYSLRCISIKTVLLAGYLGACSKY